LLVGIADGRDLDVRTEPEARYMNPARRASRANNSNVHVETGGN
jgi:hypothetical protein